MMVCGVLKIIKFNWIGNDKKMFIIFVSGNNDILKWYIVV